MAYGDLSVFLRKQGLRKMIIRLLLLCLLICTGPSFAKVYKYVAVTYDDLPVVRYGDDYEQKKSITSDILKTLNDFDITAIGFVNEGKLYKNEKPDKKEIALLEMWLKSGQWIGNHTYSHMSYNRNDLGTYAEDIEKGQVIGRKLAEKYGREYKYFRHPFLQRGNTDEKRDSLEEHLQRIGYIEAPVTIDNSDWIYAAAYDSLYETGDTAAMRELGEDYVRYMRDKMYYYERQSEMLFGWVISQVLLVHANKLNADWSDELFQMYRDNGYSFLTLDEILQDNAYRSEDKFTGKAGISWLHRWAITQGKDKAFFKGEPTVPERVMKLANVTSE